MRRAGHEVMGKAAIARFYHVQQREALILTENLLQDSNQWGQEISRWVQSPHLTPVHLAYYALLQGSDIRTFVHCV